MKVVSNKGENKKRKRGTSQEVISESSKKAKVHAQRKFAQGAAFNSPTITPIKDKIRPPVTASSPRPMLTTKCPNTEDFLTFLCFRRTSILPPKLDFFKEASTSESEVSSQGRKSGDLTRFKPKGESSDVISQKHKNKNNDKEMDIKKPHSHTSVQALAKKYQEQRIAKEKATKATKLAQKVRGKNLISTRSAGLGKECKKPSFNFGKETQNDSTRLRSGLLRVQSLGNSEKFTKKEKFLRSGLRSGRIIESGVDKVKKFKQGSSSLKKSDYEGKKVISSTTDGLLKKVNVKKSEGLSDFSSDDNEPLAVKKPKSFSKTAIPLISGKKLVAKPCLKTRSKTSIKSKSSTLNSRPSRKTKEAAAIYMEMITKKLVSPEKSGDDDISSVESFPELPNAKRNEQREIEIKAKALAFKKIEPKQQQSTEKAKECKSVCLKKVEKNCKENEKTVKSTVTSKLKWKEEKEKNKALKEKTLVEIKSEEKKVAKENSNKSKNEETCIEQERVTNTYRPSTRSRNHEKVESKNTKPESIKKSKINILKTNESIKKTDVKLESVVKKPGRKSKLVKNLNTSPKIETVISDESHKKCQSSAFVPDSNESKNLTKNDFKKDKIRTNLKKRKKGIQAQILDKETKTRKEKEFEKRVDVIQKKGDLTKPKDKQKQADTKKEEKKTLKEENVNNRRPIRKCSAADKIWIDLDGFTSDEDFLEPSSATKKKSVKNKIKTEKICDKDVDKKELKAKSEKTKEGEVRKTLGGQNSSKMFISKIDCKMQENDMLSKTKGKKTGDEGKESQDNLKTEVNGDEKINFEKDSVKDVNIFEDIKLKESLNEIKAKQSSTAPKEIGRKRKIVAHSKTFDKLKEENTKSKKTGCTVKKRKMASTESSEILKIKKPEEEEEKKLPHKRNFKGGRIKKKREEKLELGRRKRPVRQCSTGDKRWIETDSDSFSFYETSEDEDQTSKFDSSTKTENETGISEKVSQAVLETKESFLDNFSDSDEEPLRKKSLLIDDVVAKLTETKPEKLCDDAIVFVKENKLPKEVPALHPLKKGVGEPKPKSDEINIIPPIIHNPPLSPAFYLTTPNKFSPTQSKAPVKDTNKITGTQSISDISKATSSKISSPNWQGTFDFEQNPSSLPSRIDMILHTLSRDKPYEEKVSYQSKVNVTVSNVPYQSFPHSPHTQINQIPCTYQIKTISFPPPREPISTHGLDLLSEVALPDSSKQKINSRTERIEKWLNDSLEVENKKRISDLEETESRQKLISSVTTDKPKSEFSNDNGNLMKPSISSHTETHKFGQLELLESQKLLKRNLFATEQKSEPNRTERQSPTSKKTLTSVQDLLKLQKERKESGKSTTDNSPHLKNCKCNNCIVKKGWFKNKPLPKPDLQKLPHPEEGGDSSKPFESLTKAFTKLTEEGLNSKMSASVAPMVASSFKSFSNSSQLLVVKDGCEKKGLHQQKKSFLERMKDREKKEATATPKSDSNAFSPNNESSVYAFEPEPDKSSEVNEPFRSKIRDSRSSSSSNFKSDESVSKVCEDESPTISSGTQVENTSVEVKGAKTSQSASIAVQVNLDSEVVSEVEAVPEVQDGKSIEISTQTEVPEEDSDSPMFYIPLQQARAAGVPASSSQQLIQGVALKLGTEGPLGPNQRVIMKAKLVTKPPDTPSMKAVVMPQPKRIFDQKINNPPIGTVQPTTRKPPEEENLAVTSSSNTKKLSRPSENGSSVSETKSQATETEVVTSKGNKGHGLGPMNKSKSSTKGKEKTLHCSKERSEYTEDIQSPSSSSSKSKKSNKPKSFEATINATNNTWLPPSGSPKLVEAPTFYPTEKEFQDPFEFFDRIRPVAEKFGLCRIVPPNNFKPDCKVSDDMRFTAYNQYIHRMFHRWGPNVKEMMAIKKYLTTQSISLKQPPWIGGIEVDLPRLYQSVQNCGGLMKVMEKKKWHQVADMMKIPKAAQDRVTKLDDIYCKYLLPYDTLSHDERQKLFDEVEKDWAKRQLTFDESQLEDETEEENYIEECEECVVKGRNMALNQFYRIARNTMSMWFKSSEPPPRDVENEFWKQVRDRNHHICVHSGSIDSSGWGYGFPAAKNNAFSKHPWNLKVLTNNPGSVLRSLGPVMGVTVPTLHVGMVFTAFCWYRDPHGLPWIEYLHTGAPKIWYGISDDNSRVFQEALSKLLPRYIKNKTIWLPSDTAMIPPDLLVENGVSLCHTVQEPGQFILVFPRAFTSSICTGYLVSESVYFAQPSWLATAEQVFKDIQESCEPSMFSLEKLLFNIALDSRSNIEVLKQVLPMVWHVRQKEIDGRKTLFNLGLKCSERLPSRGLGSKKKKGRWTQEDDDDYECEVCRTNLYVSLVTNSQEEGVYCLPHAIDLLTQKRHQLKFCKLLYTFTQEEMNELVEKLEQKIENKSQKKVSSKN